LPAESQGAQGRTRDLSPFNGKSMTEHILDQLAPLEVPMFDLISMMKLKN